MDRLVEFLRATWWLILAAVVFLVRKIVKNTSSDTVVQKGSGCEFTSSSGCM